MLNRTTQHLAFAVLLGLSNPVTAQSLPRSVGETVEPHSLPFSRQGNTMELAVANTSEETALEGIVFCVETAPQ